VIRQLKSTALVWLFAISISISPLIGQVVPAPTTPASVSASDVSSGAQTVEEPGNKPSARIMGWSFSGEETPQTIDTDKPAILEPGNPGFVVFFNPLGLTSPTTEFRYRLVGYDPDWTVTREHIAHYRRLSPGKYTFEVQSRQGGGQWHSPGARLSVVQHPFFYQTWYFYLLVILGLVILVAQLLSQRDQLLKGQMGIVLEERNRIASDCHDTLMAGFAAISWQLEATAKLFRDTDEPDTPAAKSCELARSMVAHCQAEARRIIWDLRDSEELTNMLSQALSRAITTHRLKDSIETTLDVQGNEIPIAPGAVHHLVCIGQEAVTNAMRHANASTIQITLRFESDSLSLSIRDNGQGFHSSSSTIRTGHFGIPVMEERARKLGGVLRLHSTEGVGTEVAVTVDFQTINQPIRQQHHVVPWIGV
jgi:signal transduction histidine kinase